MKLSVQTSCVWRVIAGGRARDERVERRLRCERFVILGMVRGARRAEWDGAVLSCM